MKTHFFLPFWVVLVLIMFQCRSVFAQLDLSSKNRKQALEYCVKILEDSASTALMRSDALNYVETMAQAGSAEAQYELSTIYLRGKGVSADLPKAFAIAQQSNKNYSSNAHRLGYLYYKGYGCVQSYSEAVKWLDIAAKAGHGGAMYLLGMAYRNGYSVNRDESIADYWLTRSANKSVKPAAYELLLEQPLNPIKPV